MGYVFLLISLLSLNANSETLIKVVGKSKEHVLTSREVEINQILETILFNQKTLPPISIYIDQVLLEWAIYKEAQIFAINKMSATQITAMIKEFKSKIQSHKALQAKWMKLKVLNSEMRTLIERKWRAKKFMEFKQQSSLAPIIDEEALKYYQKQKEQYEEKDFSQVSKSIKKQLSQERAQKRLQQWHQDLKAKYKLLKIQ